MPQKTKPAKAKPSKAAKPAVKAAKAAKPAAKAKPAVKAKVAAKAAKPAPKGKAPAGKGKPAPAPAAGRKGITVVANKPGRRPKPKINTSSIAALAGQLMASGGPARKPLIASGPNAAPSRPIGAPQGPEAEPPAVGKTHLSKKELARFRDILLKKRFELVGDVSNIEQEALQSQSGSLSNLPQHMAEQGSETYDQSLALDLAAADRKLIKEIDDAIARIDAGTFGVCELTGKPIEAERLEELPWTRHSIQGARQLERRTMGV